MSGMLLSWTVYQCFMGREVFDSQTAVMFNLDVFEFMETPARAIPAICEDVHISKQKLDI